MSQEGGQPGLSLSEAVELYRVVGPPWVVERLTSKCGWQPAYYCRTEQSANDCMWKAAVRLRDWSRLSHEEKMRSILR